MGDYARIINRATEARGVEVKNATLRQDGTAAVANAAAFIVLRPASAHGCGLSVADEDLGAFKDFLGSLDLDDLGKK